MVDVLADSTRKSHTDSSVSRTQIELANLNLTPSARLCPFGFIATVNPDSFTLAIDAGSDRVVQDGEAGVGPVRGRPPSEATKQALTFCDAFQSEVAATRAFVEALTAEGLLIDRRADATLPDGRTLRLDSFQIVAAEKFAALSDATVLEWHRKGWLVQVHFHLASLERFSVLLDRQQVVVAPSQQNGSEADTVTAPAQSKSKKA